MGGGPEPEPLPLLCRAYVYALHGLLSEMLFTTVLLDQEWTFPGVSRAWPLFLYGSCGLALEGIHRLLRGDCCLLTRCTLYTLCIFLWQFCTGYVLRAFGACLWDYRGFRFNLMGLIALEHGLAWFVGSLLLERLVIRNVLRLRLVELQLVPKRSLPRFELKRD